MTTQLTQGTTNTNQINPGLPVVGGDAQGGNLVIRSTSNNIKGSVIFDETTNSFGPNSGAVQTLGGVGAQANISVGGQFNHTPYGYSVNNIMVPANYGGDYRGMYGLVGPTSASWSGGVATLGFVTQNVPPFIVGQQITVTGVTPTAYNGNWTVSACSTSSVSFQAFSSSPGGLSGSTYGFIYQTVGDLLMSAPAISISAPQLSNGSNAQAVAQITNTTLAITAINTGIITFTAQPTPPFTVGSWITVSNVTPTSYNGQWVVTACTTTQVSATMSGSGNTSFVAGAGTVSSGYVTGTTITNPGTGYIQPATVTFADPVPNQFTQFYTAANGFVAGAIPQTIAITGLSSATGVISTNTAQSLSAVSGTSVTVATATGFYPGQPVTISGLAAGAGAGLTNGTWYIVTASGVTVTLASSYQNAVWGLPYTFGSAGTLGATMTPQLPTYITNGYITFTYTLGYGINAVPFYPGQTVTIAGSVNTGANPQGFNGNWQIVYATTTTFTISSPLTGSLTVNGTVSTTPSNTPSLYIKAPQSGGVINIYQVSYPGYLGSSAPTHTYGTALSGTAGLTYVGQTAQGYSSIGYSGVQAQGAIQQVGTLSSIVITTQGSGYTQAPQIVISRPDLPNGRQAQAISQITTGAVTGTVIIDAGSGYLNPPTITFVSTGGNTTPATAVAVIGNPGEKPIVSTFPIATYPANCYAIDFGHTGHNVVFLNLAATSYIYFDNLVGVTAGNTTANNSSAYVKGFPLGRRVTAFIKNTSGSGVVLNFPNLLPANAGTNLTSAGSGSTYTLTANKTMKIEFMVLSQGNVYNQSGASYAGGTFNDVYATVLAT